MVSFPEPRFVCPGGTCFGYVEADLLVIDDDEEIVVREWHVREHILWSVARGIPAMFDALSIAAQFLAKRASGQIDFEDFDIARAVAPECWGAAGGAKYSDFYRMLVGSEP